MNRNAAHCLALLTLLLSVVVGAGCGDGGDDGAGGQFYLTATPPAVPVTPQLLPLAGPAASPEAEISALCWCGDRLILIPQHPERFGDAPGELGLFVLDRADIEAVIDGHRSEPLTPRPAILEAPDLLTSLPGWDGLEAAASHQDTVYLAVEARVDGVMAGYLLRGRLERAEEPLRLLVDTDRIASIPVPTSIPNMSQEALVLAPGRVGVIYEANGVRVNPGAHVAVFDLELEYRGSVPMEHVEYRITDACQPRADGTFWVINYFFPGEARALDPPDRPRHPVEQLLELRFDHNRVVRSGRAPLDLRQDPGLPARNWEAMVRLGDRGFLLMTDRYPTTLLAFVAMPDEFKEDNRE